MRASLATSPRSSRCPRRTRSTPDTLKEQVARLKRAAKRTPLVISAASVKGVQEALRALLEVIDGAREADKAAELPQEAGWRP